MKRSKDFTFFFTFIIGILIIVAILLKMQKDEIIHLDNSIVLDFYLILPTVAVSFIKIKDKTDKYHKIHKLYIVLFALFILLMTLQVFKIVNSDIVLKILTGMLILGTSYLIWTYKKEIGNLTQNFQTIGKELIFIISVIFIRNCILILGFSNNYEQIYFCMWDILTLPIYIIIFSLLFWGQEYAWRGELQVFLQKKFGKKIGVVLLGIIWETFQAPFWFTVYNLEPKELLVQYCVAIGASTVLGSLYMKTQNIWGAISGAAVLCVCLYGEDRNVARTADLVSLIIMVAIFLLFFFKKEYMKSDS